MSALTIFYQECPVCGRSLRISVKHFGRQMCCTHCQGQFIAGKGEIAPGSPGNAVAESPSVLATTNAFASPQLGEA